MNGVLLREPNQNTEREARNRGYTVGMLTTPPALSERTLLVGPGVGVPWELVSIGFGLLDSWEAAVPLWRAGVLAANVGTAAERQATEAVVRDLRVPLYSHELLFVRDCPAGRALLDGFLAEGDTGEPRLAFVRSLYRVKPRLCVLPRTWLAEVAQRVAQDRGTSLAPGRTYRLGSPGRDGLPVLTEASPGRKDRRQVPPDMVTIEIAPGRYVQCKPGDEAMIRARFAPDDHRRVGRR